MMLRISLSLTLGILVGCSSTPEVPVEIQYENRSYIHSVESLRYGNTGRAGAAIHQPGFVHVMANSRIDKSPTHVPADLSLSENSLSDSAAAIIGKAITTAAGADLASGLNNSLPASHNEPTETEKNDAALVVEMREAAPAHPPGRNISEAKKISPKDSRLDMSYYERSNWERYCNKGEGLGKQQILKMKASADTRMPKDLISSCQPKG